jgi:hypothetical protein
MMTRCEVEAYLEASPEVVAWLIDSGVLREDGEEGEVDEESAHLLRGMRDRRNCQRAGK